MNGFLDTMEGVIYMNTMCTLWSQEHQSVRGTLLFYHMSRPVMSPPQMIFSICPSLGYKLHQHGLGYYLAPGNDGDDDNDEKVTAFSKTTTLFEAVIAQSSV